MRFWIGGPRILGVRTGVSLSPNDFRSKAPRVRASNPTSSRRGRSESASDNDVFLFVIQGSQKMVWVGASTDPNLILDNLRRVSLFDVALAYVCAPNCTSKKAHQVNDAAQALLANHRCNDGWFDVTSDVAVGAISAAAFKSGVKIVQIDAEMVESVIGIVAADKRRKSRRVWTYLMWALFALVVISMVSH